MNEISTIHRQPGYRPLARMLGIALLAQGLAACESADRSSPGPGDPFPLTALRQAAPIEGDEFGLRGKTLLINFWATWCAPCREEMPALQALSDALDPSQFAVIGISIDEDANLVREFMLQYDIRFANFHDADQRIAAELLAIETYPETFIVSPAGIITRRIGEALPRDIGVIVQSLEAAAGSTKHQSAPRTNG